MSVNVEVPRKNRGRMSMERGRRSLSARMTILLALIAALLSGVGWLYALRGLGWLGGGPSIGDSLPLLQLAGRDGQPLERVVVAWLAAGLAAGWGLRHLPRARRGLVAGGVGLLLLLLASQASYSATRNVSFGHALFSRSPGPGPWLQAALFTVGCLLPGRTFRELRLRRGEDGHTGQN